MAESPRAAKRRKLSPSMSSPTMPFHARALKAKKQTVYGKARGRTTSEGFTIGGKEAEFTPRKIRKWGSGIENDGEILSKDDGAANGAQNDCTSDEEEEGGGGGGGGEGGRRDSVSIPTKFFSGAHPALNGVQDGNDKNIQAVVSGDEQTQTETPSAKKRKRRKQYKGWKWLDDEDELVRSMPVNNQDRFEQIAREAAAEAAKTERGGEGGVKRKALRERRSGGAEPGVGRIREGGRIDDKRGRGGKAGRGRGKRVVGSMSRAVEVEKEGDSLSRNARGEYEIVDDVTLQPDLGKHNENEAIDHERDVSGQEKRKGDSDAVMDNVLPSCNAQGPPQHPRSPSVEGEDTLVEKGKEVRLILAESPSSLQSLKSHIISGLTSTRRLPLVNLSESYNKVHHLLSQTILAGESNSMLIIGSRGTGKTTLVEKAIDDLSSEHKEDYHVVRLNGFIHTDDKLALKEIWRQLGREMDVEDEIFSGRSSYADTLTSLLALLSHQEQPPEGEDSVQHQATAKSVIFILDEFDLFASHPRQTLLYNLFDLAQSSTTPLAVVGLTTKVNVVDMLEKRVKSRFGQRYVYLSLPRTFEAFKEICQDGLMYHPSPPSSFSDQLQRQQHQDQHPSNVDHLQNLSTAWNSYIPHLLAHPILHHHLQKIYTTTKTPSTFFTSALLPLATLTPASPLPAPKSFLPQSSTHLLPPDSNLTSLLPTLSTLALSLLICAARQEILLATPLCSFEIVYEEYVSLVSKSRINASAAGHAAGQRVWGKGVARGEWELLGDLGLVVPAVAGRGGMWRVDVGLEELGGWIAGDGKRGGGGAGAGVGGLGKWCREI